MSVYGETRNSAVAPVGEMVSALLLAAAVLAAKGMAKARDTGVWTLTTLARVAERRRALAHLAELDDHMLKDIGLSRTDLRDATATALLGDPTALLVARATERRVPARLAAASRSA